MRSKAEPSEGCRRIQSTWIQGIQIQPGSAVLLRPAAGADVLLATLLELARGEW